MDINTSYRNVLNSSVAERIYNTTVLSAGALESFVARFFILISNCIITMLILALLFVKALLISIVLIIFLALFFLIIEKFFKKKTEKLASKMLEYSLKNNSQVVENLSNLKEIRIFSAEDFFFNQFKDIQQKDNNNCFGCSFNFVSKCWHYVKDNCILWLVFSSCIQNSALFKSNTNVTK